MIKTGYVIDNIVRFQADTGMIYNLKTGRFFKLRPTINRLLFAILESSTTKSKYVTDTELMNEVWDKHHLRSSSARLWQVMAMLRLKLLDIGLSPGIIARVNKCGYTVFCHSLIPFYVDEPLSA